jgi:hypothetical protein
MKKSVKKLVLSRETLHALNENDFPKVNGGSNGSDGGCISYCLDCATAVFTCTTGSVYC